MYIIIIAVISVIMSDERTVLLAAIAVSRADEVQIVELMRELGVKSKASVVRAALQTLREQLERERLRSEIQESVRKCAQADHAENRSLAAGAVSRHG